MSPLQWQGPPVAEGAMGGAGVDHSNSMGLRAGRPGASLNCGLALTVPQVLNGLWAAHQAEITSTYGTLHAQARVT